MPPNRKSNVTLLKDPQEIDVAQLKLSTNHATQLQQKQPSPKQEENYWDEATEDFDAELKRLQEEANLQSLFSASHIEANLLKESLRLDSQTREENEKLKAPSAESDDYWNMPSEAVPASVVSPNESSVAATKQERAAVQSTSYWNWPSNQVTTDNEKHVHRVLDEERARRLTSLASIEQNLVEAGCATNPVTHESKLNPANDSYWVC